MEGASLKAACWTLGRWALLLALIVAGALKAAKPAAFISDLENYRLLTSLQAFGLGLYLPWFEIVTGVALALPRWRLAAWLAAAGLGLGFSVFVGSAWLRGLDVSCGCFGGASTPVGLFGFARTVIIFLFATAGLIRECRISTDRVRK
jgi:putative oxidoreductase